MKSKIMCRLAGVVFSLAIFACFGVRAYSAFVGTDIVILHTNDVHCKIDADEQSFGYAELAAYEAKLKAAGNATVLVDVGDAVQGDVVGTLSKGEYLIDIMNKLGYDVAVPGNHEFDYGLDKFNELVARATFPYVSSNYTNLVDNKLVLDAYKIVEVQNKKIAFVGISTPETITKSTPAFFKNDKDEYIYGFKAGDNGKEMYAAVQAAVDKARAEKVDFVIAVGHLGVDAQSEPWTSKAVIANTTGIDVFLDGHSHTAINAEMVKNKDGKDVVLSQAQTALNYIGEVRISPSTGKITAKIVSPTDYKLTEDKASAEYKAYEDVKKFIDEIKVKYEELANKVVAKSAVTLIVNDPTTDKRIVRSSETNLGDLAADAYRNLLGADIAFVNGGGVRAKIDKGDITYANILAVHPFGNMACMIEATGQQILDALEMGAMHAPEESGGFLQVSGLSYEIHTYIPTSVKLNDAKEFVSIDGERRVKNVMVGGKAIDPTATYKLASHNYMLRQGGDGYTMFKNSKVLRDEVLVDNQVLINYIVDVLGGEIGETYSNPYGQGRINLVSTAAQASSMAMSQSVADVVPQTGDTTQNNSTVVIVLIGVVVVVAVAAVVIIKKKD